jgi:hypothetical protein
MGVGFRKLECMGNARKSTGMMFFKRESAPNGSVSELTAFCVTAFCERTTRACEAGYEEDVEDGSGWVRGLPVGCVCGSGGCDSSE